MKDCHPEFPRMPVLCPCILQVCKNTSLLSYYNSFSYFSNYTLPTKRGAQHKTNLANCWLESPRRKIMLSLKVKVSLVLDSNMSGNQNTNSQNLKRFIRTNQNIFKYFVSQSVFFVSFKSLYSVTFSKIRKT